MGGEDKGEEGSNDLIPYSCSVQDWYADHRGMSRDEAEMEYLKIAQVRFTFLQAGGLKILCPICCYYSMVSPVRYIE